MITLKPKNEQETIELAKKLSAFLTAGMTLLLKGDLGAGKTTFTKGIGAGLGIKRVIKSPTYTLIREYTDGRLPLYHIDLYRLSEGEVFDLGLYEYFNGEGISVVEWPSVAPTELPNEYLEIYLKTDLEATNQREITFRANGDLYEKLLKEFNQSLNKNN